MAAQTSQPQATNFGLPQQCSSSASLANRRFTGDANRAPANDMEANLASSGQASMLSSAFNKASAASQINIFPAGTAPKGAPSPSKKRIHRDLKLKSTAAAPGGIGPSKANPFAQYGVTDAATKPAAPARLSPNKGAASPKKSPRRVARPSNGVQGMSIDTPERPPVSAQATYPPPAQPAAAAAAAASFPGFAPQQTSVPGAFSSKQGSASQPLKQPPAQMHSSNPFAASSMQHQAAQPSQAVPSTAPQPSLSPSETALSSLPDSSPAKQTFSSGMPPAAATGMPAFEFGEAKTVSASPQHGFTGFGLPQQPPEKFGFQAGSAAKTPGRASCRKPGHRARGSVGPKTPGFSPVGSPMEISPQPVSISQASSASPMPPQPMFSSFSTSAWDSGRPYCFQAPQQQQTQAAASQQRKPGEPFNLTKSRFMPQEASDPKGVNDDAEDANSTSTGPAGVDAQHPQQSQPGPDSSSDAYAGQPAQARAAALPFPFLAPNRPMDSRIPEACANSFLGINLNSTPPEASDAHAHGFASQTGVHSQSAGGSAATARKSGTHQAQDNSSAASHQPHPSAARHADRQTNAQAPVYGFTPGVKTAAEGRPRRVIHDGVRLATNLRDQLDLGAQLRPENTAARQDSQPGTDLPQAQPQMQSQAAGQSTAAASAKEAKQNEAAASVPFAKSQTFVFGPRQSGSESDGSSTSQSQAPKPFVFGAATQVPTAAPVFGTAQRPQQGGPPAEVKLQWGNAAPPSKGPAAFCGAASGFTAPAPQQPLRATVPPAAAASTSSATAFPPDVHASGAPGGVGAGAPLTAEGSSPSKHNFPIGFSPGIAKHTGSRNSSASHGRPSVNNPHRRVKTPHRRTQAQQRCVIDLTQPQPEVVDLTQGSDDNDAADQPAAGSSRQHAGQHGQQVPAQLPMHARQPVNRHDRPQRVNWRPSEQERVRQVEVGVEQLRQQGNLAFAKPDFTKAGQMYTQALNMLSSNGIRKGAAYVRLLTNRAACFLSLSKPLQALQDCHLAVEADPTSVRAATRAATCFLKMGEPDKAAKMLETVAQTIPPGQPVPDDLVSKQHDLQTTRQLIAQATSKLENASTVPAVSEAQKQLEMLCSDDGYCPFSQPLTALNAHALLRLQRLEDAVKLAQRHAKASGNCPSALHWPWWVQAQAHFLKGDLTLAQHFLQQGVQSLEANPDHEEAVPSQEEVAELQHSIRNLLQLKEAGNKAVQLQQWQEAIAKYTDAIAACTAASPAFAAVLHSNRAAAYQGVNQYADAIADSLRSKALDPSYGKAHSRLAAVLCTLCMSSAVVSTLEQLDELCRTQGLPDTFKLTSRLIEARSDVRRKQAVHHYRLLGLAQACAVEEVRKAYKKSSLRFHPDKAMTHCKFAFSLGPRGAALANRQEVESRVRDEANWLFKCISEAHNVLSDARLRRELDAALELEERRMFYKNDLTTPPGGAYSFRPAQSRPAAQARPANAFRPTANYRQANGRSGNTSRHHDRRYWFNGTSAPESDDSEEDAFGSNADYGSNFY